jgi:hypothetical protein
MPIPSTKWFPARLQERSVWYATFFNAFSPIAVSLGFTAAELTAIQEDQQDLASIAATQEALDNYVSAFRQFRISVLEDPVGTPAPTFPAVGWVAPPNLVPAGVFQRLISAVDRIRAHPTYTDEMGANLGIKPATRIPEAEGSLKPSIKVTASELGYKFTANVVRQGLPAFKLQLQREGESSWTDAVVSTTSSIEYTVTPTTPGQPERVLVRAILYKGTEAVGQPSDPTYVTVNP